MYSYVARQPIVDRNKKTVAFELLYRDGKENSFPNVEADFATKSILMNEFLMHQKRILDGKQGFINFGFESLLNHLPFDFPSTNYTIEILENCLPCDELLAVVIQLKKKGYTIALDDFIPTDEWCRFYEYVDIIKFDIMLYPIAKAAEHFKSLSKYDIQFLAEKVETYEEFCEAKACGFHLFQGYFFSKPEVIQTKVIDPSINAKIQLSAAVSSNKVDVVLIEQIIASNPGLSLQLLTFVNQSSSVKEPIKSLYQALVYLGEERTRKFVTYAAIKTLNSTKPNMLINLSLQRAKFFELILGFMHKAHKKELGYLCGMLSLIDALLDADMATIFEPLNLNEEIKSALLDGKGILADIIKLAESVEQSDWEKLEKMKGQLNIEKGNVLIAYTESIVWAGEIIS